jgi:protein ImuA
MYSISVHLFWRSGNVEHLQDRTISLEKLRRRIARLESGTKRPGDGPAVPSGCEALDRLLPERGFCRGTLVEWLSAEGGGACTLALLAAKHACGDGGTLAVFDDRREFCPPAAVRLGIEPEQLLVVHADTAADNHWAIDQALRSQAVAAVLAWPRRLDDRTFRRWQLAAEEGGCLAMLLRPETARAEPSWADVRLLVVGGSDSIVVGGDSRRRCVGVAVALPPRGDSATVAPTERMSIESATGVASYNKRRLRIVLLRCRGGNAGRDLDVELDDETYRLHSLDQHRRQLAN